MGSWQHTPVGTPTPSSPGTLLLDLEWTLGMQEMMLKWVAFLTVDVSHKNCTVAGIMMEAQGSRAPAWNFLHGVTISLLDLHSSQVLMHARCHQDSFLLSPCPLLGPWELRI